MRSRWICGTMTALAGAMVLTVASTAAQGGYKAPRTPWGEPDLQGIWNGNDLQGIPMQRDESLGTRNVLNDEEFRQRVQRRDALLQSDNDEFDLEASEKFERFGAVGGPVSPPPHWLERAQDVSRQASFLVDPPDGRMPPLTPEAQKAAQQRQQQQAARRKQLNGIEAEWVTDRSLYDRCISLGPLNSLTPKIYNSGQRIVQGPGWVAFSNEMIHETRVIPTDGRPSPSSRIRSWMGTSVGRWDGDTLVVTTTGVRAEMNVNGQPLSEQAKITERFTRAADNILEYRMTVEDPKTWTAPWTVMLPFPRDDDYGFHEYACHEGNYTMFNILSGARAEERERAKTAAPGSR